MATEITYRPKVVLFVTKHRKQHAVSSSFQGILGAKVIALELDTDMLGTFSGEVERKDDRVTCARKKCEWGLQQSGVSCVLSSEGSFAADPMRPALAVDTETLYYIDAEHDFHLHLTEHSYKTNYKMRVVSSLDELVAFSAEVGFPEHALIIRPNDWRDKAILFKGINSQPQIVTAFEQSLKASRDNLVWVETDMRACFNPSRMGFIAELAEKMALRLTYRCPGCMTPGWGVTSQTAGLECRLCDFPTRGIKANQYACVKCEHTHTEVISDTLKADPALCFICNP